MEKSKELVSIITPVYNASRNLVQCISSVLSQSFENWEHILVDDCSTDKSAEIILANAKKDPRIKYIKLKKNSGAGIARNTAIKAAQGNYIAFLDSDDYWHPEKLKKQIFFMKESGFAFTYSNYFVIEKDSTKPKAEIIAPQKVDYKKMLKNDYIGCLTVIYDTNILGKNYMPEIRKRQDWVLWLCLLKKVDYAYGIQEPLAFYRVGNSSLSRGKIGLLKHNFGVYYNELGMSYFKSIFMMGIFLINYFYFKTNSKKKIN